MEQLKAATEMLVALCEQRRECVVNRTDSYGSAVDESVRALDKLVAALASKEQRKAEVAA